MIEIPRENQLDLSWEKKLLDQSICSARSWRYINMIVGFPEDVRGLKVLDVGGGGSDATAVLLEKGADAWAIDPRYKSRSDVKGKVRQYLLELTQRWGKKPPWDEFIRSQEKALERFIRSARERPERYIVAYASSIPFPDNYFDFVFSTNCITEYLDVRPETFLAAISECVRVTKPCGQIHVFPFEDFYLEEDLPRLNPEEQRSYNMTYHARRENQARLLELLEESGILDYAIFEVMESNHKKLVIYKKPV